MSRAMFVQPVQPITTIMCQMLGCSTTAKSARISTSVGMQSTTSVMRLMSMSTVPPANPPIAPRVMPRAVAMPIETNPTKSAIVVPCTIWAKTSTPSSLVPNQL